MEQPNDVVMKIISLKYLIPLALSIIVLFLKVIVNREFDLRNLLLLLNGYPANLTVLSLSFLLSYFIYIAELFTVKDSISIIEATNYIYGEISTLFLGILLIIVLLVWERYNEKKFYETEKRGIFIVKIICGWIFSVWFMHHCINCLDMIGRCFK